MRSDLGSDFDITAIQLTNRDAVGWHFNGAIIEVLDLAGNVLHSFASISSAADDEVFNLELDEAITARSIYIDGAPKQYQQLTEIYVFESFLPISESQDALV